MLILYLYESPASVIFWKIMAKNSSLCNLPITIYFTGAH